MASKKPLKFWSCTISKNHGELPSVERMKDVFDEFAHQWCFQLEQGATAGKLHYQGRIIMEEAQMGSTMLHIISCRGIDKRDITFLPESNKSIEQGGLAFYVMKDDTRVKGPWYDPSYNPKKRKRYEGADLACMEHPLPFQQQILDFVTETPDDRTLNWVVNVAGCAGKSKLMKYMRYHKSTFDMARIPLGSATQIKTSVIAKGAHGIYMVDLPRVRGSDERQSELFSALEEVKNGWVESAMYGKTDELLMEPPHIWIFSNEWPSPGLASVDRWKVYKLEGDTLERASLVEHIQQFTEQSAKRDKPFTVPVE